jgi:hypothetical protein
MRRAMVDTRDVPTAEQRTRRVGALTMREMNLRHLQQMIGGTGLA